MLQQWKIIAVVFLVSLTVTVADDATSKEIAKIQGTWQLKDMEVNGVKSQPADIEKIQLQITKERIAVIISGKTEVEGTYKILEVKDKIRKTDLTITANNKTETSYNIAKWLDDDTFQTCLHSKQRPTEFKSTEQNGQILMTFQRVKK